MSVERLIELGEEISRLVKDLEYLCPQCKTWKRCGRVEGSGSGTVAVLSCVHRVPLHTPARRST